MIRNCRALQAETGNADNGLPILRIIPDYPLHPPHPTYRFFLPACRSS